MISSNLTIALLFQITFCAIFHIYQVILNEEPDFLAVHFPSTLLPILPAAQ